MSLPTRKIGNTDVTAIGYGAMGIAAFYGQVQSDEERFKVRSRLSSLASHSILLIDRRCSTLYMNRDAPTGIRQTYTWIPKI